MRIARVDIERFRGFGEVTVLAGDQVLLVGEPRAGRSDLLAAIRLVVDSSPTRTITEDDFHNRLLDNPAHIELTIVDLPDSLRQRFLDRIEYWDPSAREIVESADDIEERDDELEIAVRIACRLMWDPDDDEASLVRYWPGRSNPAAEQFDRVARVDREVLPIVFLTNSRPLNLAPRGAFRALAQLLDEDGVDAALDAMRDATTATAESLGAAPAIAVPTERVFETLTTLVELPGDLDDLVRLLPDGGSLAAMLRSLVPAPNFDADLGHLALPRHGSTTETQVATAELIATANEQGGVVIVDDFGDRLDSSSAEWLARLLRQSADQLWLATRRPETARSFAPSDIVRLTRSSSSGGSRAVFYGQRPASRAERVAHRELHRQILPAMTSRALIICEGVHDLQAFNTLAELADSNLLFAPPEAHRVRMIDAGSIDRIPALGRLARSLGFRTVALIDYDNRSESVDRLTTTMDACDAVVRYPEGYAIERALGDVPDAIVVEALTVLGEQFRMNLPTDWTDLGGSELQDVLTPALKSNGGLHSQYLRVLDGALPGVALVALQKAIDGALGGFDGHIQL